MRAESPFMFNFDPLAPCLTAIWHIRHFSTQVWFSSTQIERRAK